MNKSIFTCPACSQRLNVEFHNDLYIVSCTNRLCKSESANHGASAQTEKEAFRYLRKSIETETLNEH